MAKITTIIDIGSNSMRMVVFKKTSRFAFHLINESKSKVKISEGCYENNGNLQDIPMQRAYDAIKSFLQISKNLKSRKIICVATSALRDAPNKKIFIDKVSKDLKLNIKVIDGEKEAYYGAVAALNLIEAKKFTTVDIGGGSTEFAFVDDKKIEETISLKIGTVRIKELYFDKNDLDGAKEYIHNQLSKITKGIDTIVGLGGSIRALSRMIMAKDEYPLKILHEYKYQVDDNIEYFNEIINAKDIKELKKLGVQKDRYDTIITGTFIFKTILEYFNIKTVITSEAGVRDGVYLTDILRTSNHKFPANFNISVRSLLDRYIDDSTQSAYLGNNARKLFDKLKPLHKLEDRYKTLLIIASKLQLVGTSLGFDQDYNHSFFFILNGLNYNFTHEDKMLIAIVTKTSKNKLPKSSDIEEYKELLPDLEVVQWLNFMMKLNSALNSEFNKTVYDYILEDNNLIINSQTDQYIVRRALDKLKAPIKLKINY